ncbi:uncharacterized protein K444DRAFT_481502, partial [Hyaloscypha bicolor E]
FFEENGSDFTIVNAKGEGLLHACAKGGESPARTYGADRISQWLMEVQDLDPLAEDIESRSALDVATASGCTGILELFRR